MQKQETANKLLYEPIIFYIANIQGGAKKLTLFAISLCWMEKIKMFQYAYSGLLVAQFLACLSFFISTAHWRNCHITLKKLPKNSDKNFFKNLLNDISLHCKAQVTSIY